MENRMNTMTVAELAAMVEEHLTNRGYSKIYIQRISSVWRTLEIFCGQNGEQNYRAGLGEQFLAEMFNAKNLGEDRRSLISRAIQMLTDFQQFGRIMIGRRKNRVFPPQFAESCNAYLDELRRCNQAEATINHQTYSLHSLTEFLDSIGVRLIDELTLANMNDYIKSSLCHYRRTSASTKLRDARGFLRFLYKDGRIADDIGSQMMKVKAVSAPIHLPSAFTAADIEKLLASVDRVSPKGKRDYAILLLAAKTGLRASDIRNLKFENLDWENSAIRLTQVKTKEPLTLPLLQNVGWAIIDYVKHGRPASDSPHIFLRARAPYEALDNFDTMLGRYLQRAEISTDYVRHHGLHALRHGLATALLQQNTPLNDIQDILGHVRMETTEEYMSINVSELRKCALEVPTI